MDHSAITFSLKKGDDGFLTGFSLTAVETNAGCFCVSFPFALSKEKARIKFSDGKICFIHDGLSPEESDGRFGIYSSSEGGSYEDSITPEDAAALQDLLAGRGVYAGVSLRVVPALVWGKGFELIAERSQEVV